MKRLLSKFDGHTDRDLKQEVPEYKSKPRRYTKFVGINILSNYACYMSHRFQSFYLITVRTCGEELQTMSYYRMPKKLIFSSVIPSWNKRNILMS
jgi:hypothetical protein